MSDEKNRSAPRRSWSIAALTLKGNRVDLMNQFNQICGAPSPAVDRLQQEFIDGVLEPAETVAFAKVCFGLVDAAEKNND